MKSLLPFLYGTRQDVQGPTYIHILYIFLAIPLVGCSGHCDLASTWELLCLETAAALSLGYPNQKVVGPFCA